MYVGKGHRYINLVGETSMGITESQITTETKLKRIAYLSARDPQKKFGSLMHHYNVGSLKECFEMLDGRKALGIDGIDKEQYGKALDKNLGALIEKMKRMAYRPGPVRLTYIPKEGKPGAKRPLGISNLEDKIVQKMTQRILDSIYEPLFLPCSYGFRQGIGCHDAIRDLQKHLYRNQIETVIDLDLENYFGSIDHRLLEIMLREKIKDEKFMRYIIRMFKAGVLTEGELQISEEGVAQGSICSPVLANLFAHYVIDEWVEHTVKPRCKGMIRLFRYADDAVICCQYESDALRIKEALAKRLNKYKLKLNEDKTKMVNFRKVAGNNASFDFLGFTHYIGQSKSGAIIPKLKTIGKRFRAKLKKVNEWARNIRNRLELKEIWERFCLKLRGHINYYGVSHNMRQIEAFVYHTTRIMFKWLNRRSQRKSFNWDSFSKFIDAHPLPKVKIYHRTF
jgi:RNA-directed DNA polymerase